MGLEKKLSCIKKFALASVLSSLTLFSCPNPVHTQTNAGNVEEYLQNKISALEQTNPEQAEKTKNLLDNIIYEKAQFNAEFKREISNAEFYQRQKKENSWDLTEKTLGFGFIALNAIDAYQSCEMIGKKEQKNGKTVSYIEKNPYSITNMILGDTPSDKNTILFRTFSTAAYLAACDLIPKYFYSSHTLRKTMLGLGNSYELGFVINNEKVTGGILFKESF